PDRIYFDLQGARLSPALLRKKIQVTGDTLSQIRFAQNPGGVVRVVLDVSGVKDYAASLMRKPTRLVIELYSSSRPGKAPVQSAKAPPPPPIQSPDANENLPATEPSTANEPPTNIAAATSPVAEEIPSQPVPAPVKPTSSQAKGGTAKSAKAAAAATTVSTKP